MTYLTPEQVAERYQLSQDTLKEWRYKRVGPKFVHLGKRVRYAVEALEAWEAEQARAREVAGRAG
jgi:predicted DNA-binding transcriptional regulator AlpA